jgi:hypothetical protein
VESEYVSKSTNEKTHTANQKTHRGIPERAEIDTPIRGEGLPLNTVASNRARNNPAWNNQLIL